MEENIGWIRLMSKHPIHKAKQSFTKPVEVQALPIWKSAVLILTIWSQSRKKEEEQEKKKLLVHVRSVKSMAMNCGSNNVEQQKEQFLLNIAGFKTAPASQAECTEVDTFNSVQWERKQRHKSELTYYTKF